VAARSQTGSARTATGLAPSGILLLVALTVLWGLNWPFMKLALATIPPWTFRTLCLVGGGGLLLGLTVLWGKRINFAPHLLPALTLVGLFNITGWHLFSAYALLNTGAGRAAIIGYTMPLWASALSVLFLSVRIGLKELIALALGMSALAVLLYGDLARLGGSPLGVLLMSGAAVSWAIGTVLIKRLAPWPLPVTALTGWQLVLGSVPVILGMSLIEGVPEPSTWSWASIIGTTYAVTVAMVFCHTAYFKLVELLPAHVAAISVLAVPVVGVVSGALMLGEVVGPAEITALALVISGLILLNWPRSNRP